MPFHLKKRTEFWQKKDREVHFLLMPSDFAIVIQVVIVGENYPCFVSGAAADLSFDKAVIKAFQEAEYGLVNAIYNPQKPIDPREVFSPEDHGRLYAFPDFIANIAWLWCGESVSKIPHLAESIERIKSDLDIAIVNLSEDDSSIKISRVFSEKLVPINFGFSNDYFTHLSVEDFDTASQDFPHYFA